MIEPKNGSLKDRVTAHIGVDELPLGLAQIEDDHGVLINAGEPPEKLKRIYNKCGITEIPIAR